MLFQKLENIHKHINNQERSKVNHYFPRLNLYFTAIPKTGCTSLLNYFIYIEKFLENENQMLNDDVEIAKIKYEHAARVHLPDGSLSHKQYSVEPNVYDINPTAIKLAAIRNPYERFTSFWFDKVVLRRDPAYYDWNEEYFNGRKNATLKDIRTQAITFLSGRNNKYFEKEADAHLLAQSSYLYDNEYNLFIPTKKIGSLIDELSILDKNFLKLKHLELPHFNQVKSIRKRLFLNKDLFELIKIKYQKDFDYFQIDAN